MKQLGSIISLSAQLCFSQCSLDRCLHTGEVGGSLATLLLKPCGWWGGWWVSWTLKKTELFWDGGGQTLSTQCSSSSSLNVYSDQNDQAQTPKPQDRLGVQLLSLNACWIVSKEGTARTCETLTCHCLSGSGPATSVKMYISVHLDFQISHFCVTEIKHQHVRKQSPEQACVLILCLWWQRIGFSLTRVHLFMSYHAVVENSELKWVCGASVELVVFCFFGFES